jgi:hypothetical protein
MSVGIRRHVPLYRSTGNLFRYEIPDEARCKASSVGFGVFGDIAYSL